MAMISVRHYQESDREAVLRLSADTAFFGEPVEAFLEDRNLYNDAIACYYVDHQVAYVWVAETNDRVIGFILGCADTRRFSILWKRYLVSRVLMRALTGKYKLGHCTASFAFGMISGAVMGEEPKTDLKTYPAHLQIDVAQGYRGMGIGHRLIEAYIAQLRRLGIGGVHLQTTSHNIAACKLYEAIGFQLLDSRPNRFWTKLLAERVNNLSYGLKL